MADGTSLAPVSLGSSPQGFGDSQALQGSKGGRALAGYSNARLKA